MTPESSISIASNRRGFLKLAGTAGVGSLVFSGAVVSVGCGEKISFYVSTVIGSLETLSPLLPGASGLISKAVSVAKSFDEAYKAGKFSDSISLFTNLGEIALQIATVAGVASPPILVAIAVGRVALNAIAQILKSQMKDPVVAGLVAQRVDPAAEKQKAMISFMADDKMIQMIVAASKP